MALTNQNSKKLTRSGLDEDLHTLPFFFRFRIIALKFLRQVLQNVRVRGLQSWRLNEVDNKNKQTFNGDKGKL